MKIVQLVPAMEQGGVERGVLEMNRALVAAGHENTVVTAGGRLVDILRRDGARVVLCNVKSKNPFTFFSRAAKLGKILDDLKPDVVTAHSRVPAWLFRWANRKRRIKWITFAHGANSISPYSRVMTAGDLTVTPSRYISDYLKEAYGIAEEKLRTIPRAIDRAKFDVDKLDGAFIAAKRREWGVEGKFVAMGVGRITQLKGYDTLIRATAILKAGPLPDIKTVIVGEAEELRKDVELELRRLVEMLDLQDSVVFAGNQQKIAECLTIANVVASTNTKKPEAFGRSMAEALAMNRPVVATAFGGALDIVENGVNGYLVPIGGADENGFAEAIAKAARTRFGDLRGPALEKFSFDRMTAASLAVYDEVAALR